MPRLGRSTLLYKYMYCTLRGWQAMLDAHINPFFAQSYKMGTVTKEKCARVPESQKRKLVG